MENVEIRIRYLEMIQRIIDRLSSISVIIKGWAVTLTAALLALAAKDANRVFFLIAYLPSIAFWLLDAWYLMLERQYRVLYEKNASICQSITSFKIERPQACRTENTTYSQCFFSITVATVYVSLIIAILCVMFIALY